MTVLWVDLETRSRCDLKKRGVYNYAADPSTEILICCWALDNEPVQTWQPWRGEPIPQRLHNALRDARAEVRAHNAAFERLVLGARKYAVPIKRWHCTSMQARACAMPASLGDLTRAAAASMQKDHRGAALIRALSVPQSDGSFNEDPELMREFAEYCAVDVGAMRTVSLMLPPLTDEARTLWVCNEQINDRGVPIDTELCELALKYAEQERRDANDLVIERSRGALKKARGVTAARWVYERLPEHARYLMQKTKAKRSGANIDDTKGRWHKNTPLQEGEQYDTLTLDADTRSNLLQLADEHPEEFDADMLEVLGAMDAAAAASVAKFERMLNYAQSDGRLRGAFVANGAGQTGRFSSHGAQLHNFPRLTAKDPEAIKAKMRTGAPLGDRTLTVLKSMLRPAVYAGSARRIVRCDWSAVEARGLPWLANDPDAERYLDAFRDASRDIYVEQARECHLASRQSGKVVVLSLGYGGGARALSNMARAYGEHIEHGDAVVTRWRRANQWAPSLWAGLEKAARRVLYTKRAETVGRLTLDVTGSTELPALVMTLPSGRRLYYPEAKRELDSISYLKSAWKPKRDATEWPHAKLWGGLATENATQAVCGDLLRAALVRGVRNGLDVIGHVHDEIVVEAPVRQADNAAKELKRVMLTLPRWAKGLPLAAETDVSERFRK